MAGPEQQLLRMDNSFGHELARDTGASRYTVVAVEPCVIATLPPQLYATWVLPVRPKP